MKDDKATTVTSEITADSSATAALELMPSYSTVTECRKWTPSILCVPASTVHTTDSEDSDAELCLPDFTVTLSPLPFSPYHRLGTVSPLPPTPPKSPISPTISPLPVSPAATCITLTPLSPLPPSPHCLTLSPLPKSPVADTRKLGCCKRLDLGRSSVAPMPFEDFVITSPPKSVSGQYMLSSSFLPTSKQRELDAVDLRFQDSTVPISEGPDFEDLGPEVLDLKSTEKTEQAILLETSSKRNKKRHRIPEKPSDQSPVTKVHRSSNRISISDSKSTAVSNIIISSSNSIGNITRSIGTTSTITSSSSIGTTNTITSSSIGTTSTITSSSSIGTTITSSSSIGTTSTITGCSSTVSSNIGTTNNSIISSSNSIGISSTSCSNGISSSAVFGNAQPLPLPQQQLAECMQCPLPLPSWLVKSMATVQTAEPPAPSRCLSGRKAAHKNVIFNRQEKQKVFDYVKHNLERMVCGFITLSSAVSMFSNPKNLSCPVQMAKAVTQFILKSYFPKIEEVVGLFKNLQEAARDRSHAVDPLSPTFPPPLVRAECQMVALFIHMCQMNAKMATLLTEITKAFYQTALTQDIRFHQLLAFCRMLTAVCRFQGDVERLQFLCSDLLRKPLKPSEFHVFTAIASVWPVVLARLPDVPLIEEKRIVSQGVEQQSISFTLELILTAILKSQTGSTPIQMMKHFKLLCNWKQGWAWTNDVLIRGHLWPTLQQWNNKSESIREATVVCIIRLFGFISGLGLAVDQQSVSIIQLQKVLISLIEKAGKAKEAQD
eukprot:Em0019g995a